MEDEPDFENLLSQLYEEQVDYKPIYISKRIMDVTLSSLGLILTLPVTLATAAAIKIEGILDPSTKGPVLFNQKRYGHCGKPFQMLKFRSMIPEAEEKLAEVLGDGFGQVSRLWINDDPRVTKVGRYIRKHCIDELPQLLNVLKGDMSLVGPRPRDSHDAYLIIKNGRTQRFGCPPGITGPVQTTERSSLDHDASQKLNDGYADTYKNRYSIWLDAYYMLKTIPYVLKGHRYPSGKY